MAKKNKINKPEVSIFWVFASCAILYFCICYFNSERFQRDMSQESVRKFATAAAGIWFVVCVAIASKDYRLILFRSRNKKEAVKQTVKKAGKAAGTYILKDKATGAETLYIRDEQTGQWVSQDGSTVLDMDNIDQWDRQRESDREFIDKQNEKLRKRDTAVDRAVDEDIRRLKEENEKIDQHTKEVVKNMHKYGTTSTDPEKIKEIIERDQRINEIESRLNSNLGNASAVMEFSMEAISKLSDYSIDALGELTGPAGKYGIKSVYITARNVMSRLSDAWAYGKDTGYAVKRATVDTIIDLGQAHLPGNYKFAADSGGDGVKAALDAAENGEDPVVAFIEGFLSGGARNRAGAFIDKKFESYTKNYLKTGSKQCNALLGKYQSGQMSKNVFKGTRNVLRNQISQNVKALNAGKAVTNDIVNDITKKTVDWTASKL